MGAYHTLDLEINRKFTLTKPEWDSVSLERVDIACDPTQVTLSVFFLLIVINLRKVPFVL